MRFFPNTAPYSNAQPIIQTVTSVPTSAFSANGRTINNNRWDYPPDNSYPLGFGPQLLVNVPPIAGYSHYYSNNLLPRWIIMTRDGLPAIQDAATIPSGWRDYSPDNPNAAIGRFAFNAYNVGGLLDANAAGYDETAATSNASLLTAVGQKGTPGLAQLSVLPGMIAPTEASATAYAKTWRNNASGKTANDYLAYLGFMDLGYLGLPKNGTSGLSGSAFFQAGPKSGFLQAATNTSSADNRILSRQDLIRLALKDKSPYGLNVSSLPYLTHFSREVNAPSWSPTQNALAMGGNNGTGTLAPYAYLDNKDQASVPNRFLPNVRVATGATWRRLTGELAVEGEPLIKYRFPLSWLAVLQDATPTTSTWDLTTEATAIVTALDVRNKANGGSGLPGNTVNEQAAWLVRQAFGLVWDPSDTTANCPPGIGGHWNYTGSLTNATTLTPVALKIALLGEANTPQPLTTPPTPTPVCRDSREPNFFELLKAGILSGSLGNASDYESMCVTIGEDCNPDYQVMQIGVNIIDQADSDSFPTKIVFGHKFDNPGTIQSPRSPLYQLPNAPPELAEYKVFSGVEDLPYIYTFLSTPYRLPAKENNLNAGMPMPNGSPVQTDQRDSLDAWLQFVLWKPQQQAISTVSPSKFRILYTGSDIHLTYQGNNPSGTPPGVAVHFGGTDFLYVNTSPILSSPTSSPNKWVKFTDAPNDFRAPTVLGGVVGDPLPVPIPAIPNNFTCSQPQGSGFHPNPVSAGAKVPLPRGLWLGEMYRPEKATTTNKPTLPDKSYADAPETAHSEFRCGPDAKFELQYDQDGNDSWRTYQRYDRFAMGTGSSNYGGRSLYGYADSPTGNQRGTPIFDSANPPAFKSLDVSTLAISAIDPRSHRFGLMAQWQSGTSFAILPNANPENWKYYLKQGWAPKLYYPFTMYFGPSSSDGRFSPNWGNGPSNNPWQDRDKASAYPIADPERFWTDNSKLASDKPFCKDLDLIQRRADGDFDYTVRPMELNYPNARTQDLGRVLNRPFRSVGELGYVFRDEPYKSLNLFTDKSADSALLDFFSVSEQPAIVAGKVNLNTKNPEVLQALIVSTAREELSTTNTITKADALTIAQNLVNNTNVAPGTNLGPIMNPAEIANRLATIMPVTGNSDQTIKARREVVGRALAGSGQTRTWNFLVDIIAQSGRYAPNATAPAQFVVDGEKRYWLHVAIDRYTGQVVDQQFESVLE